MQKAMINTRTNQRKRRGGFTLIELVITITIIAILAAIAYPAYQDSTRSSRRAGAQALMLELVQWMERFYTEHHRYDQTRAGVAVAVPVEFSRSPSSAAQPKFYDITLVGADLTASTFTVQAAPAAGSGQDKDYCGTLTLNQAGVQGIDTTHAGITAADCW
jgi:type IV pilus assembly protein PilE